MSDGTRWTHAVIDERFWEKVQTGPGCWEWTASLTDQGYGQYRHNGTMVLAHRHSFVTAVGPIPSGMFVCHRCDNRRCIRPSHLFLGDAADNQADMAMKMRSRYGTRAWNAKLSDEAVEQILAMKADGRTQRELAEMFGVAQQTISKVITRQKWRHVGA